MTCITVSTSKVLILMSLKTSSDRGEDNVRKLMCGDVLDVVRAGFWDDKGLDQTSSTTVLSIALCDNIRGSGVATSVVVRLLIPKKKHQYWMKYIGLQIQNTEVANCS